MKRISWIVAVSAVLIAIVGLYVRCTKVNTDQPCGQTTENYQLFKDANNKCYYVDPSSHTNVYVDKSKCNCY